MTLTITRVTRLNGGPTIVMGTETAINLDTSNTATLTSYVQTIDAVIDVYAYKAASAHALATIDYTTTDGVLATTFLDPTENITINFTIAGR